MGIRETQAVYRARRTVVAGDSEKSDAGLYPGELDEQDSEGAQLVGEAGQPDGHSWQGAKHRR